jgi:hypothetical protein
MFEEGVLCLVAFHLSLLVAIFNLAHYFNDKLLKDDQDFRLFGSSKSNQDKISGRVDASQHVYLLYIGQNHLN